ncbi:hypothetical protein IWW55_002703 [Coemansia sp. RSA 2706]|nr:hypothetical protein IWW55_002703 [Coemansia sp. RSA 2706]
MLDQFTIATKGGVVLWTKEYAEISGNPVDSLIQNVLIQSTRTESTKYHSGAYSLQWTFANELNVMFVAVYQKILQLPYLDDLLLLAKRHFVARFAEEIKALVDPECTAFPTFDGFDEEFERVWRAVEERDERERKDKQGVPRKFEDTKKFQSTAKGAKLELEELAQANEMAIGRKQKMRTWNERNGVKDAGNAEETKKGKKGKKKKENRVWEGKATKESMKALDFSGGGSESDNSRSASALVDERSKGRRTKDGIYDVAEVAERSDGFQLLDAEQDEDSGRGIFGIFKNLTSGRVLTEDILSEPMARMREHLANKNVAADIADEICQTVARELVGVRVGGLQNIRKLIEQSMETSLTRILTPVSSTDIIRDIEHVNQAGRPYTIAFVGVNGVGKSTNLSKVCYWLLQNNKRVLIAACDTFRSGAVEQLRVHVRNLRALSENQDVEIFERGYGKDSAAIARDAIASGTANGFDVVLIDTAGRMQDNEPLMRALSKLVSVNKPDKIMFVGEALVGNEAVDQLQKFNQAMRDFSGQSRPRQIDGIILTKFDTIDDRVGAALSMTYITGQPIVFVGTGQTYTDLRRMNVAQVIRALLRPRISKGKKGLKKKVVDPFSRKEWYDLRAPTVFETRVAGKTLVNRSQGTKNAVDFLKGRVFEASLGDLNHDEEQAFRKFRLRIDEVAGRHCLTSFHSMSITTDKLRSLVKKWQTLIEATVTATTTDGYRLRLFVLAFTQRHAGQLRSTTYAQTSQVRAIREKMVAVVESEVQSSTLREVIQKFIPESMGREIEKACHHIFPLQNVLIRKCKVTKAPRVDAQKLLESHGSLEDAGTKIKGEFKEPEVQAEV